MQNNYSYAKRVNQYIAKNIDELIIPPRGLLLYSALTPSLANKEFDTNRRIANGVYTDQYDWDTYFISQTLLYLDKQKYSSIVQAALLNMPALQSPEGFTPRTIGYSGIRDFPGHAKPFLFQTALLLYHHHIDLSWLKKHYQGYEWNKSHKQLIDNKIEISNWKLAEYDKFLKQTSFCPLDRLEKYLQFYDNYRKIPQKDWYSWNNVLESGVDTSLALWPRIYAPLGEVSPLITQNPVPKIAAVDLNMYLFEEFNAAAQIFQLLGDDIKSEYYQQKAAAIKAKFIQTFWSNKDQFFYNHYYRENGASELIDIPAWIGILPLASNGLIDAQTEFTLINNIINKQILSEDAFMTKFGLRSLSRKSAVLGGDSPRSLVPFYWFEAANWNGPIWILPNIFAMQILYKYGYDKAAKQLLSTINKLLAEDISANNKMHEQYSYFDGRPGWGEYFMSWNTLIYIWNDKEIKLRESNDSHCAQNI